MSGLVSLLCLFILVVLVILAIWMFLAIDKSMVKRNKMNALSSPQTTQVKQQALHKVAETDKKLEQILNGMSAPEKQIAKEKALEAFQSGIQGEVRKNAMNILSILGEVEKF